MTQRRQKRDGLGARHANKLLLAGLVAVACYNYWLFRRDKVSLREKSDIEALPAPETWPRLPKVSVLVAAWNEEANIHRHIRSFKELRYPHKQLVLCAGGTDRTYAMAAEWAGSDVTVLEQRAGEGKQRALRRCLDSAGGKVVFLTDADCLLDDEPFERTIYPIVIGREKVCTGGSRPFPEMMTVPFVVAQAAPNLYSTFHAPTYASGLLGRNCAIDRRLLESSRGLDAPAATGTDYVLAKMVSRTGARIRHLPESRIATEYPTTVQGYLRQRRRWLRNVALHGWRFGATDEMQASLFTSLVGLAMLVLPLSTFVLGKAGIVAWLVLLTHAFLSRLRYLRFTETILGYRNTWRQVLIQVPALLLDFVAWSRPLLDYVRKDSHKVW